MGGALATLGTLFTEMYSLKMELWIYLSLQIMEPACSKSFQGNVYLSPTKPPSSQNSIANKVIINI